MKTKQIENDWYEIWNKKGCRQHTLTFNSEHEAEDALDEMIEGTKNYNKPWKKENYVVAYVFEIKRVREDGMVIENLKTSTVVKEF